MPTILINLPSHGVTEGDLATIRALAPAYDVRRTQDRDEIAALASDVEILARWPVGELLVSGPGLKWY